MDDELARRLDAIERRLATLEHRLPPPLPGLSPIPAEAVMASIASPPASSAFPPPVAAGAIPAFIPPATASSPVVAGTVNASDYSGFDDRGYSLSDGPDAAADPLPSPLPGYRERGPKAESVVDLEHVLGLKWAGWVGAIVLVIGAALGIKFGYDQGWFGGVPDAVRCLMIAAAGIGFIAAGEVVYRRVDRLSATGLYGAGVAVLFLAAYAGQAWYALIGPGTATVLMALVAAVGMAVAARADLVSVAALTLLGAGVVPLFFEVTGPRPGGFGEYLLALQAMALGLCAWRATPKWWALRGLSLAVTTPWMLDVASALRLDALAVVVVSAAAYQFELLVTTARATAHGIARRPAAAFPTRWGEPVRGVMFSLLVTAALAAELMIYFARSPAETRGNVLIGLAAVAFALSRVGRGGPLRTLARGFEAQGVLLLTLAIPVTLRGPAVLFGWMALAAGLGVLAAMTRDRLAAYGATAVWGLTAIGAFVWASVFRESRDAWLHVAGEAITGAVVIGFATALAGHVIAVALRRSSMTSGSTNRIRPDVAAGAADASSDVGATTRASAQESAAPAAASMGLEVRRTRSDGDVSAGALLDVAAVGLGVAMLMGYASPDFATWGGLAYGLALWAGSFAPGLAHLATVSTGLLALVAVKWAAVDVLGTRLSPAWRPMGRMVWNTQTATGVTIAVAFGLSVLLATNRAANGMARRGLAGLGVLAILLVAGSAEIDRYAVWQADGPVWIVRQVGWSVYWSALAVAALIVGFLTGIRPLRLAALMLLAITLLKVTVLDLAGAGTGWRILSFLGLGVLLLLTSVLYGKFKGRAVG